jgi:hypothetical protein
MIKDVKAWEAWEREYLKKEVLTLEQKYRLLDALYEEARDLGIFPLKNPMEGFEVDIRVARILNQNVQKTS